MSYNGSGTFTINSTGQPVVAGTVITASAFNALTTDLATGLTTAITKDGQTTTTARITFAQGITSSLTTDSSSTSTGSIITAGGAGIAKNLYVGGALDVAGATTFTNPVINNIKMGYTTTATAAGTTTLTVASNYRQFFTGTSTQTIVLPVTSTLVTGIAYEIENNSTGTLTVNSSGGNLVGTIPAGVCAHAVCIGTTLTTAADWDWDYISTTTITGTGANVLGTSPTITTPVINGFTGDTSVVNIGSGQFYKDTSGNVGIGVTPSTWTGTKAIEVGSLGTALWSSGAGSSTLTNGAYYNSGWKYANATSKPAILDFDNAGKVTYYAATATSTAGSAISLTQLLAVEAGKSLALQGATTQTGTGITFPATQSASSDANTLDDYEEGTWTPNQGAGLTVVGAFSSTGTYTKVGRLVYVRGVLTGATSISCTSGTALTSNLPFSTFGDNPGGAFNASLLNGIILDLTGTSVFTTAAMTATSNIFFNGTYGV